MDRLHLVVDAMNVIGSRPTGWWRDRPGAIRRLARSLQALAEAENQPITIVIDGRPLAGLAEGAHGCLYVLYASRSKRGAADDRIVEFVTAGPDPAGLEVVTADRELIDRVRRLGASVSSPGRLLRRLDEL
jgi:predicted RNA-binding protein with PIN domain